MYVDCDDIRKCPINIYYEFKVAGIVGLHLVSFVPTLIIHNTRLTLGHYFPMLCLKWSKSHTIQWNLRIKDNLGPSILSLVRRLSSPFKIIALCLLHTSMMNGNIIRCMARNLWVLRLKINTKAMQGSLLHGTDVNGCYLIQCRADSPI